MDSFYPYINLASLFVFGLWGSYRYIESVMPAQLEKSIGSIAYDICSKKRGKARFILSLSTLSFVIYTVIPVPFWPLNSLIFSSYIVSSLCSLIFLVPGLLTFVLGRKALGKESEAPKSFRKVIDIGIYSKIRHPQLLGELLFLFFFAFLFNSVFLLVFTAIFWIPNYLAWCHFEEKDLLVRYGEDYEEYMRHTKKLIPFIF